MQRSRRVPALDLAHPGRVFAAIAVVILILDQFAKAVARASLVPGGVIPLVPGFLQLVLVKNTGAAFGLFQGGRFVFVLTSLLVRVVVDLTDPDLDWNLAEEALVEAVLSPVPRGTLDPFSMIASVIGNKDDRFTLGSVYFDDGHDYVQVDTDGRAYASRRAMRDLTPLDVELSERDENTECLGCGKKAQSRDELRRLSACASRSYGFTVCGPIRAAACSRMA